MNLFKKWKEEWWVKNSDQLAQAYASEEASLKAEFEEHLAKDRVAFNLKLEELRKEGLELETRLVKLGIKKLELDEMEKRIEEKKLELSSLNSRLLDQIRTAEREGSPSHIWAIAFTAGWDKAWGMMLPFQLDGVSNIKKTIEDKAIQDTLRRISGNHKKIN